jgi:hypothetical protein
MLTVAVLFVDIYSTYLGGGRMSLIDLGGAGTTAGTTTLFLLGS